MNFHISYVFSVALLIMFQATYEQAFAQGIGGCGTLEAFTQAGGPFDYRAQDNIIKGINSNHFNRDVEMLIKGQTATTPVPDIDFILRHIPNHHLALNSMANYDLRHKPIKFGQYTTDCWFDRAIRFAPDDGNVRLIYGIFLAQKGKKDEALVRYKEAINLMPDSAQVHYNIGLLYLDGKQYELANNHAVRAYELGYPLPWLRNRLQQLGVWNPDLD